MHGSVVKLVQHIFQYFVGAFKNIKLVCWYMYGFFGMKKAAREYNIWGKGGDMGSAI